MFDFPKTLHFESLFSVDWWYDKWLSFLDVKIWALLFNIETCGRKHPQKANAFSTYDHFIFLKFKIVAFIAGLLWHEIKIRKPTTSSVGHQRKSGWDRNIKTFIELTCFFCVFSYSKFVSDTSRFKVVFFCFVLVWTDEIVGFICIIGRLPGYRKKLPNTHLTFANILHFRVRSAIFN